MDKKRTPDEKKQEIREQAKRLKHARKDIAGHKSFKEFAENNGISPRTFENHEQGSRGMKPDVAKHYSDLLGVNFDWLYYGKGLAKAGEPDLEDLILLAKERASQAVQERNLPNDKRLKSALGAHIMLKMEKQLEHKKDLEVTDDFIDYVLTNLLVTSEVAVKKE